MSRQSVMLVAVTCLVVLVQAAVAEEPVREWSNSTGKFKVMATLVSADGKNVQLRRKSDGKVVTVPMTYLSNADREYVARQRNPQAPAKSDAPAIDLKALFSKIDDDSDAFMKTYAGKTVVVKGRVTGVANRIGDGNLLNLSVATEPNQALEYKLIDRVIERMEA